MNLAAGNYVMVDNDKQDGPPNVDARRARGVHGHAPARTASCRRARPRSRPRPTTQAKPQHSFEITGLKVGKNRLRLVDEGEEVHHAIMFPIAQGKTIEDVETFFATEGQPSGPPPIDFEGGAGTAAIDGDSEQVTDLVLRKAGTYAVICFLTDRDGKDPKPHLAERDADGGRGEVVDAQTRAARRASACAASSSASSRGSSSSRPRAVRMSQSANQAFFGSRGPWR